MSFINDKLEAIREIGKQMESFILAIHQNEGKLDYMDE